MAAAKAQPQSKPILLESPEDRRRRMDQQRRKAQETRNSALALRLANPLPIERALNLPDDRRTQFLDGASAVGSDTIDLRQHDGYVSRSTPQFIKHVSYEERRHRMEQAQLPECITVRQAAHLLRIKYGTMQRLIAKHRVAARQPGAHYQIRTTDVLAYAAATGFTAPEIALMHTALHAIHLQQQHTAHTE